MTSQIRPIVATMVVTFAVSFPILWSQRGPRDAGTDLEPEAPSRWAAPADPHSRPGSRFAAQPATAPPFAKGPPPDVPPFDDAGPPLPVYLSVSTHPGPGPGEDGEASIRERPDVIRQVDLLNDSSEPLDITVLVVDVPTQKSTRAALFVPSHAQAHVGSESGLKIVSGDMITLQSRGFRALTQTVP